MLWDNSVDCNKLPYKIDALAVMYKYNIAKQKKKKK